MTELNGIKVIKNIYIGKDGKTQKINPQVVNGNLYIPMFYDGNVSYLEINGDFIREIIKTER